MSGRRSTPKGQMTRGASGPAIMMMPPHIRATFMPNPPLKHIAPIKKKRKTKWAGMYQLLSVFEKGTPPKRAEAKTPKSLKAAAVKQRDEEHKKALDPQVKKYKEEQQQSGGEFEGMSCYNTLFVGRLAYEVTERKLLREFEVYGPVKDLKLIKDEKGKSKGYGFVEYEHEEDMKRAYRAADGLKLEGREIVVDVERGHTVQNWLPRRLGGGLGGTRLGGKTENVKAPGRFDPSKPPDIGRMGMGRGMPPPPHNGPGFGRGGPPGPHGPPPFGGGGPGGPPGFGRGRGDRSFGPPRGGRDNWERHGPRFNDRGPPGGDWRKRQRSRSPEQRRYSGARRRY